MDRLRAVAVWATAHPYRALSAAAAVFWGYAIWLQGGGPGGDWYNLTRSSQEFTSSAGLHLYAQHPQLTFGPLALLVVIPLRYLGPHHGWQVTSALLFGAGVVCLRLLDAAADRAGPWTRDRRRQALVVGGLLVLISWIGPAGAWGHADDVFALVAVAVAVWAAAQDRWLLTGVMIGIGAGFKPWAIFAIALAMHGDARRWRGPAVAVLVSVLPWLPFEIADHHTLDVTHVRLQVFAASGLRVLGVPVASHPSWTHSVQLAVAVAAGVVVVARRRWALVPLVAFIARIELDPATWSYYGTGVILGALAADLIAPLSALALRTFTCALLAYYVPEVAPFFGLSSSGIELVRLGARLAVIPALVGLPWVASRLASVQARKNASTS